ncbi:MAG: flippase-like domain-containing protein [Deltaproteobacteria bacterium]|nr:flippase-like domain-containing protein [Deltaproteobacteria bacterium]MBW2220527.1 flippase-like domain-containing protein [Deltaproteobacteria bacterium]
MNKKMAISFIIGGLFSVLALYFAFRNVPFNDLANYLVSINYAWVIPSVFLVLVAFLLRALRWQIMLKAVSDISFKRAYHPLMIGFMLNCILPARAGEFARPAILQRKDNVPFTSGLATVATERVFDLFFLIIFFAIVFSSIEIDSGIDISFGAYRLNRETLELIFSNMVKICFLLVVGIILVTIDRTRRLINKTIMLVPELFFFTGPRFKEKLKSMICGRLVNIVNNIAAGFGLVKNFKQIMLCLVLSFIIWVINALSYYVMSIGCPGMHLSLFEITAVMIIICFFIALPSVPGFWGLWEAGGVFALSLFAVSEKDAAGFALASHAVQMFPVIIAGLISALVYGVNIRQIKYSKRDQSNDSA